MDTESKSRVVYENLDTTFVNLWALLRNLAQRGFIGRVRVELKDYTADIFMTGSSTPLVHETDRAAGTDTLEEAALHRVVLRVRETAGTISVFEGAGEAVAVQTTVGNKAVSVAEKDAVEMPAHYADDALTEIEPVAARVNLDEPARASESPTIRDQAVRQDEDSAPTPEVKAAQIFQPATDSSESFETIDETEWTAILKASGELIAGVERALTGAGADFAALFDGARLEVADDYTFLDPMSGGFTYASSVVTLHGAVPAGTYAVGLSEALRRVVDRVADGERARRVRERVALELFSVVRKRKEILARSGFLTHLDRIAGTKVI